MTSFLLPLISVYNPTWTETVRVKKFVFHFRTSKCDILRHFAVFRPCRKAYGFSAAAGKKAGGYKKRCLRSVSHQKGGEGRRQRYGCLRVPMLAGGSRGTWEKAAVKIRATVFRGMIRAPVSYFHDFFSRFFVFILPFWYIVPIFGSDKRGEKSNKTKKSPHRCRVVVASQTTIVGRRRKTPADTGKKRRGAAENGRVRQMPQNDASVAGSGRECRQNRKAKQTGKQNRSESRIKKERCAPQMQRASLSEYFCGRPYRPLR